MTQSLYSQSTIRNNLNIKETLPAVKRAFKAHARGNVRMPAKIYLEFEKYNGDLRTMPAYIPDFNYATVKLVNAHPDNPSNLSLPTVMALVVAFEPETGKPVAILDGTVITSRRTAAASALATKHFSAKDARCLGFLGTGSQARDQLNAHQLVRDFQEVQLYDKDQETMKSFGNWINEHHPDLSMEYSPSPKDVIFDSDVVISLTPSHTPLVELDDLPERLHINAMGADAPEKREWDDIILKHFELIVDSYEQACHSGEISQLIKSGQITEESVQGTLGEALLNDQFKTSNRTLFDSTGLAIQDTATVNALLDNDIEADAQFDFLNL